MFDTIFLPDLLMDCNDADDGEAREAVEDDDIIETLILFPAVVVLDVLVAAVDPILVLAVTLLI